MVKRTFPWCKSVSSLVYNKMSTVAVREYTIIITLGDPVKVLISCWGLKDNTHLYAFVLNNAPCLAWTWVESVSVCNLVTAIRTHAPSEVTQVSIFFALASKMREKIRFHYMSRVISAWKAFLNYLWVLIIFELLPLLSREVVKVTSDVAPPLLGLSGPAMLVQS